MAITSLICLYQKCLAVLVKVSTMHITVSFPSLQDLIPDSNCINYFTTLTTGTKYNSHHGKNMMYFYISRNHFGSSYQEQSLSLMKKLTTSH